MTTTDDTPRVSAATRGKLLKLLVDNHFLADAAAVCGLDEGVAHVVAAAAGWPDLAAVDRNRRRPFQGVEIPTPRDPAPVVPAALEATVAAADAVAEDAADHEAIRRLRELAAAARSGDDAPDAVARVVGSWTHWELAEVAIAAVAILPPEETWGEALAWVDGSAEEASR